MKYLIESPTINIQKKDSTLNEVRMFIDIIYNMDEDVSKIMKD